MWHRMSTIEPVPAPFLKKLQIISVSIPNLNPIIIVPNYKHFIK